MGRAILFSRVGAVASEFPGFVSELQRLFVRNGLEVSSFEAVGTLAELLRDADSALAGELRSALSELFLVEGRLSYLDALGLLLAAAAGEERAEQLAYAPGLEEPVQELFRFVVEARPTREQSEEGAGLDASEERWLEPEDAPGVAGEFAGPVSVARERVVAFEDGGLGASGLKGSDEVHGADRAAGAVGSIGSIAPNGSMLARALALSADDEVFGSGDVRRSSPPAAEPLLVAPEKAIPPAAMLPPRWIYALMAGGVVLGLLLGLLLGWQLWRRNIAPIAAGTEQKAAQDGVARDTRDHLVVVSPAAAAIAEESARERKATKEKAAGTLRSPAEAARGVRPAVEGTAKTSAGAVPERSSLAASPTSSGGGTILGGLIPGARKANLNAPADVTHGQPAGAGRVRVPRVEVGSAGIMAANVIASPVPTYPLQASMAGVEGEVVISAVVGRDGSVVEARVVSGPEALREAARKAVEGWRYRPYEIGGKAVEIITTARVDFHLKGE